MEIALDAAFTGIGELNLQVTTSNDDACESAVSRTLTERINVDDVPDASATDTFETRALAWTPTGTNAANIWSRTEVAPFEHAVLGIDFGVVSDTQLVSPELNVGLEASFIVSFSHRFQFESSGGVAPFFDGGVIEVSRNGGPWHDIMTYAPPGYNGTLFSGSGNPLGGRQAFVNRNTAWPATNTVSLNLGAPSRARLSGCASELGQTQRSTISDGRSTTLRSMV